MPLNGDELSGLVGHLIGASLESAGQHVQSQLLDVITGRSGQLLGGLLYLMGLTAAIFCIATGASYRFGRWLLIGPALFAFLTTARVDSSGARWQFGDRTHDPAEVKRALARVMGPGKAGPSIGRVSYFFAVWNRITSDIVQDLIKLLHITASKSDLDFLAKSDRYLWLFDAHIKDPLIVGFLNISLVNNCANYLSLQRTIYDPTVLPVQKRGAAEVLRGMGKHTLVFNRREHPWWNSLMQAMGPDLGKYKDKDLYTCDDLWQLSVAIVRRYAEQILNNIAGLDLPEGLSPQDVLRRLREKAEQRLGNGEVIGRSPSSDEQKTVILINELTARLIYKELSALRKPLAAMNMNEHPQVMEGEAGRKLDHETSRAIRSLQRADEYQHKGELIAAALTLPDIQGMLLYFLAMIFPFFALMVIVPGRHTAVATWMSLWLWAKLWDFGFAVCMMIDNMLYSFLPHGPPINDRDLAVPGRAMTMILEVDPMVSAHMLNGLESCCILGIPFLTGLLVHKGGSELVSAVSEGFKEFPTAFGNSLALYQRSMKVQQDLGDINRFVYQELQSSAWEAVVKDPEVLRAVMNVWRSRTDQGVMNQLEGIVRAKASDTDKAAKIKALLGSDAIKAVFDAKAEGFIAHNKAVALAGIRANLGMIAFHASNAPWVKSLNAEGVGWGWGQHDSPRDPPFADLVAREQAKHYYPMGKVWDTGITQALKKVFGKDKGGR